MSSSQASTNVEELVLCHRCRNEWWRNEHGLQCPQCGCDIVEIVDPHDDPREVAPSSLPSGINEQTPYPDPRHASPDAHSDTLFDGVRSVVQTTVPGVHAHRHLHRSSSTPVPRHFQQNGGFFNNMFTGPQASFTAPDGGNAPRRGHQRTGLPPRNAGPQSIFWATGTPLQNQSPHVFMQAGQTTWTANGRTHTHQTQGDLNSPVAGIHAIMQAMLGSMNAQTMPTHPNSPGANPFAALPEVFRRLLDPAEAVHGDAVFTQEALDRIVSQMMEQNSASTAPGPASDEAIASLPKKKIEKTMLGSDGKAECSVCMDNVDIGTEVTILPCDHWFHEECVTMWLKEHDTCPHCRRGITSPTADNSQASNSNIGNIDPNTSSPSRAPFMQPGMQLSYVPGDYQFYPEPQNYVQPSPPNPSRPQQRASQSGSSAAFPARLGLGPNSGQSQQPSSTEPPAESPTQADENNNNTVGSFISGILRNLSGNRETES